MDSTRLRAILSSGSSIVFDARGKMQAGAERRAPFFDYSPLKRALVMKISDQGDRERAGQGLKTFIYLPYDGERIGDGGASILVTKDLTPQTFARFFGTEKVEEHQVQGDLEKLKVFAKVPSFAPFLLRDAFERAGIAVPSSCFAIAEAEANALKDSLKARLRPLATLAQDRSSAMVDAERIDNLVRHLWQLDDMEIILPLSRALQVPDADAAEVLYAWIGVSYFQCEFANRQMSMRWLVNWLVKESDPVEYVQDRFMKEFEADRKRVRLGLRWAMTAANETFRRYDESYQALIGTNANPMPFVAFMRTVRGDFYNLGAQLSLIEQCHSVVNYCIARLGGERAAFDNLRQIMASMREIVGDVGANLKAA